MHLAQITGLPNPVSSIFPSIDTLLGDLASRILLFAIAIAGFYFFVNLLIAGFNFMNSMGHPDKIEAAQQQITHSLFGLIIVITTYFIGQIIEKILNLNIL